MEENKAKAEQRIEADEIDVLIFTDGSAEEGCSNGGVAFVAMKRQDGKWTTVEKQRAPAGKICSSFQAEMKALLAALKWLHDEKQSWRTAKIVSDSQSSLKVIEQKQIDSRCELRSGVEEWLESLADPGRKLLLEWVPCHCGIDGNEKADAEAAKAAKMNQEQVQCSFAGVKRRLKRIERRKVWANERCEKIYG